MDWQVSLPELLSELPKGVATAVALLLIFLGYRKGTTDASSPPKKDVEIAGALVDNSAIFKLASAIEHQNELTVKTHEYMRHIAEGFTRHADEVGDLAKDIRDGVTAIIRTR